MSFGLLGFWVSGFVCWVVLVSAWKVGGKEESWNDEIVGRRGVLIPSSGGYTQKEAPCRHSLSATNRI
jgi:hypothetical protein